MCCTGAVDVNTSDSFQAVARGLEWLNFQVALVGSAAASTIPASVPDFDVSTLADVSSLVQEAASLQDQVRSCSKDLAVQYDCTRLHQTWHACTDHGVLDDCRGFQCYLL
jgi:hypothetical protein